MNIIKMNAPKTEPKAKAPRQPRKTREPKAPKIPPLKPDTTLRG